MTENWKDRIGAEGEKRIGLLAVGLSPEKDAFRSGAMDLPTVLEEVPVYYAMGRYQPDEADTRTLLRMDILEKAMEKDPAAAPAWLKTLVEAAESTSLAQTKVDLTDPAFLDPILDLIDGR